MTPCNRLVLESDGEFDPDELLEGDASGVIDDIGMLDCLGLFVLHKTM